MGISKFKYYTLARFIMEWLQKACFPPPPLTAPIKNSADKLGEIIDNLSLHTYHYNLS